MLESVLIANRGEIAPRIIRTLRQMGIRSVAIYSEADKSNNVQAIIPGHGFLCENAQFARQCEAAGLIFIGPTLEQIWQLGLKHIAYEQATQAQLPFLPHTELLENIEAARSEAQSIGYPVMLKCSADGSGIGLAKCANEDQLIDSFVKVQRVDLRRWSRLCGSTR